LSTGADVGLLTNFEVAGRFHVAPQTATRWGMSGRLLTVQTLGGHYRFFEAEVGALLSGETREQARELAEAEKARLSGGGS
jgi:predicted site-specific integrase-resolvase